jgi:hypothetical protein
MDQILRRFDQLKSSYNFYEVIVLITSDNVNQHNKCFEILTMESYTMLTVVENKGPNIQNCG